MFAGTSTGGIIAALLASGKTARETMDLYTKTASTVFTDKRSLLRRLLLSAKYSNHGLLENLKSNLPMKISELKKGLLVTALKLCDEYRGDWEPVFINNMLKGEHAIWSKELEYVYEAALATASAPTLLPAYKGFIDGGCFANNPSMSALTIALEAGIPLSEIKILSISTGDVPRCINSKADWGLLPWTQHLMDMWIDGTEGLPSKQCRLLLGAQGYHRIDPALPQDLQGLALDDHLCMPRLVEYGYSVNTTETVKWINQEFLK